MKEETHIAFKLGESFIEVHPIPEDFTGIVGYVTESSHQQLEAERDRLREAFEELLKYSDFNRRREIEWRKRAGLQIRRWEGDIQEGAN